MESLPYRGPLSTFKCPVIFIVGFNVDVEGGLGVDVEGGP
jgi:hypothetical protein